MLTRTRESAVGAGQVFEQRLVSSADASHSHFQRTEQRDMRKAKVQEKKEQSKNEALLQAIKVSLLGPALTRDALFICFRALESLVRGGSPCALPLHCPYVLGAGAFMDSCCGAGVVSHLLNPGMVSQDRCHLVPLIYQQALLSATSSVP